MIKLKKILLIVALLLALTLTGCSSTKSIKGLQYVGIDGHNVSFEDLNGQVIKFIGYDSDVRLLVKNQKYTVVYYFNSFIYNDYAIDKVILDSDNQ